MAIGRARRILIAGGGIGGLAAALALQHRGFETVVFERADSLRDGGAGLHIWSNGVLALDYLGVAEEVLKVAPVQHVAHFTTWRGEVLGAWPVGDFIERYGAPTIAVERSVLHGVLRDALTGPVLRTGARVVSFDQDADGVTVRFADGSSERGDLLIGADGIHGTVRDHLSGPARNRFSGYIAWRGRAPMEHPGIPPGTFNAVFGPGTRFTYYDVAPGLVHWMSVANGAPGGRDKPGTARAMLLRRHEGWAGPVADILRATPEEWVLRGDVEGRRPEREWGRGRVTLLGDAAHPITFNIGQGACQALEDALVLAEHLDQGGDPVTALRRYESERMARTAPLQKIAWRIGKMGAIENPLLIRVRESFMRKNWNTKAFRAAEQGQVAHGLRWAKPGPAAPRRNTAPSTAE